MPIKLRYAAYVAAGLLASTAVHASQDFSSFWRYDSASGQTDHVATPVDQGDRVRALRADFRLSGTSAALQLPLVTPVSGSYIRFDVRAPFANELRLRVQASSAFIYPINRAASSVDEMGWTTVTIPLAGVGSPISRIDFLLNKEVNKAVSVAYFRNIRILAATPSANDPPVSPINLSFSAPIFLIDDQPGQSSHGGVFSAPVANGDLVHPLPFSFPASGSAFKGLYAQPVKNPDASYIRFKIKGVPGMRLGLRVMDNSDETHQYEVDRSVEKIDNQGWATYLVKLDRKATSVWGGDNNKTIDRPVKQLALLVNKTSALPLSGNAYFKEIELLDHPPSAQDTLFPPLASGAVTPTPLLATGTATLLASAYSQANALPYDPSKLTTIPDGQDSIRKLAFDFTQNGNHTDIDLNVPSTGIATPANGVLRFLARVPKSVNLAVHYWDNEDKRFETDAVRPLDAGDDNEWVPYAIKLGKARNTGEITGPVKRIALIAHAPANDKQRGLLALRPTGVVEFKQFTFEAGAHSLDLAPGTAALPGARDRGSDLAAITMAAVDLKKVEQIALAKSAGFKGVRGDMTWQYSEGSTFPPQYNFNVFKDALEAALAPASGPALNVVVVLGYNHNKYHSGDTDKVGITATNRQAFVNYARAAAQFINGLHSGAKYRVTFEIWNEPNNADFWKPSPNPDDFASLLQDVRLAIQGVSQDFTLASGGLAVYPGTPHIDYRYIHPTTGTSTLLPQLGAMSCIGLHPYDHDTPERQASQMLGYADYLLSTGYTTPPCSTEVGVTSARFAYNQDPRAPQSLQIQAHIGLRNVLTAWSTRTPLHGVYRLRDVPQSIDCPTNVEKCVSPEELNYGLFNLDDTPKPAGRAMTHLLKVAGSRQFEGLLTGSPTQIQAMKFSAQGKETVYVVWSNTVGTSRWPGINTAGYTVTAKKGCDLTKDFSGNVASTSANSCVTDMQGNDIQCPDASHQGNQRMICTISETSGPIFIRMSN